MRDNRYCKGQAFFVEEFVELLSFLSWQTGLSIDQAAGEVRKEDLQAILWVYVSAFFSATKYYFLANLLFSWEIFTECFNS